MERIKAPSNMDIGNAVIADGHYQHYNIIKELADCYAISGQLEQAADHYKLAAELAEDKPDPHVGLGTVAIQAGMFEQAEDEFKRARRIDPSCAEAYGGLAMVYQRIRDYPAAIEMYLKCMELDTDNLVALLGLFQTSCKLGTFEKIIHYLEIYLNKHPGDTAVMFCLASLYAREDRLEDAREILLNLLALEPDKSQAVELLEQIRLSTEQSAAMEVQLA